MGEGPAVGGGGVVARRCWPSHRLATRHLPGRDTGGWPQHRGHGLGAPRVAALRTRRARLAAVRPARRSGLLRRGAERPRGVVASSGGVLPTRTGVRGVADLLRARAACCGAWRRPTARDPARAPSAPPLVTASYAEADRPLGAGCDSPGRSPATAALPHLARRRRPMYLRASVSRTGAGSSLQESRPGPALIWRMRPDGTGLERARRGAQPDVVAEPSARSRTRRGRTTGVMRADASGKREVLHTRVRDTDIGGVTWVRGDVRGGSPSPTVSLRLRDRAAVSAPHRARGRRAQEVSTSTRACCSSGTTCAARAAGEAPSPAPSSQPLPPRRRVRHGPARTARLLRRDRGASSRSEVGPLDLRPSRRHRLVPAARGEPPHAVAATGSRDPSVPTVLLFHAARHRLRGRSPRGRLLRRFPVDELYWPSWAPDGRRIVAIEGGPAASGGWSCGRAAGCYGGWRSASRPVRARRCRAGRPPRVGGLRGGDADGLVPLPH